jgi:hypothetical protein
MGTDCDKLWGVKREVSFWRLASCLILATAVTLVVSADVGCNNDSSGDLHVSGGKEKGPPILGFACDGSPADWERMFSQPDLISDLKELHASLSLALPDLSPERARLVLRLNQAGIPVIAWLALPPEQGYYLNASNPIGAEARFAEFERWTASYGLRWAGIGLDIEPSLQDFAALKQGSKWNVALTIIGRYFHPRRVERAKELYAALISEIRAHGYPVETYQFPFIADERAVCSTLLDRLAGIVDVRGDREVLMLYTSFNPTLNSALIWVYGPDAQAIAVGSTSGSDSDPDFVPLNWEEFSRDLVVAHHFSQVIGVYSLQGCVRQGFLHRLRAMNWDQSIVIPANSVRKAERLRTRIQEAIWIGSHLQYFAAVILVVTISIVWAVVRWRKQKANPPSIEQRGQEPQAW